jgi:hypothetical protein
MLNQTARDTLAISIFQAMILTAVCFFINGEKLRNQLKELKSTTDVIIQNLKPKDEFPMGVVAAKYYLLD